MEAGTANARIAQEARALLSSSEASEAAAVNPFTLLFRYARVMAEQVKGYMSLCAIDVFDMASYFGVSKELTIQADVDLVIGDMTSSRRRLHMVSCSALHNEWIAFRPVSFDCSGKYLSRNG
mgnify:CR=1 FL=1